MTDDINDEARRIYERGELEKTVRRLRRNVETARLRLATSETPAQRANRLAALESAEGKLDRAERELAGMA